MVLGALVIILEAEMKISKSFMHIYHQRITDNFSL